MTPAPIDAHALSAPPAMTGMFLFNPNSDAIFPLNFPAISVEFIIFGNKEISIQRTSPIFFDNLICLCFLYVFS